MYLLPLNYTLKMVKLVNFILCIFYHDKKEFYDKIRILGEQCEETHVFNQLSTGSYAPSVLKPGIVMAA